MSYGAISLAARSTITAGHSVVWCNQDDDFAFLGHPKYEPYAKWDCINTTTPNAGTAEVELYGSSIDLTHMSYVFGGPDGGSQYLSITPQNKDGQWWSTRLEGKDSYGCPEGKSLILEATFHVGEGSSDEQGGVWPAFWALGESYKTGTVWPLCGEWDIFESSDGHDWMLPTLHWGTGTNDDPHKMDFPPDSSSYKDRKHQFEPQSFHTWSIKVDRTNSDWKQQTIQWFMDDTQFYEAKGSDIGDKDQWSTLAYQKYFPIFNVAIGNNFPEHGKVSSATEPGVASGMVIQYVAFWVSD